DNTGLIKVDQHFGDRDVLTGRWGEFQGTAVTAGALPQLGGTSNAPVSRSGVLTETHTFSPAVLNEFRFGFSRNQTFLTVQDSGFHIRREEARRFLDGSARSTFNFHNFADFASGLVNTSQFFTGSSLCYWKRYPLDVYWQDSYKIKTNLTLNYGVRYEYPSAI